MRAAPIGGSHPVGLAYRNTSDAVRNDGVGWYADARGLSIRGWPERCAPRTARIAACRPTPYPVADEPSARYWRAAEPKSSYDVVIVGAGGHGLATAYYLAANHGITDVCVVEKGWLGGGNMARNTTIIRSNYLWDESAAIYEHSLKLWEGLEETLAFDMQFSQRGVLNLAHDLGDIRSVQTPRLRQRAQRRRRGMARRRPGEGVLPDRQRLARRAVPGARRHAAAARRRRAPRQGRVGVRARRRSPGRRHRRARRGHRIPARRRAARSRASRRPAGTIRAGKVALAAAGHTSVLASMVGPAAAAAVAPVAGAGERAVRAGARLRRDVQRRARLRVSRPTRASS